MDCQKKLQKDETANFKIGDLVRYVRVVRGITGNLWQRIAGFGIIVAVRDVGVTHPMYDILSNDEVFDVLEIYPVELCT